MMNPLAGEVEVTIDGQAHVAKLTLGALAELEDRLGTTSTLELVQRFEQGHASSRDVLSLIVAGLRGGGWQGRIEDLMRAEVGQSPLDAGRIAALLLARAFTPPA